MSRSNSGTPYHQRRPGITNYKPNLTSATGLRTSVLKSGVHCHCRLGARIEHIWTRGLSWVENPSTSHGSDLSITRQPHPRAFPVFSPVLFLDWNINSLNNNMMYWRSDWAHKLIRKLFTKVINQVRGGGHFPRSLHTIGLLFVTNGATPCWPLERT